MKQKAAGNRRLLPPGDLSTFCSQVCMVLRAAIPISEGIAAIGENVDTQEGKELIRRIQPVLEQKGSLSESLKAAGAFPDYMVSMIDIGEKAGKLDDVMEALALYYEREDRIRNRIRSAVVNPLILTLMMAAVVAVLLIRVLPVFNDVFHDMGSPISAATSSILYGGTAIGQVALVIIALLAVLLIAVLLAGKTRNGYRRLTGLASVFGFTRRLSEKIDCSHFASVFSMMLSSGYDTSRALELIPNILTDSGICEKISRCRASLDRGESFPNAMEKAHLFPGIYGSMVRIGTKTGNLDEVMKNLAERYSEEVDESIGKAVSFIEPAMVAVLSIVIGAILLSVMLPLMGIMSSIG